MAETHFGFEVSLESLSGESTSERATDRNSHHQRHHHHPTTPHSPTTVAPSNNNSNFHTVASVRSQTSNTASPTHHPHPPHFSTHPALTTATTRGGGGGKQHTTNHQRGAQMKPVISFQDEWLASQKVNRTQYAVAQWPALGPKPKSSSSPTHARLPLGAVAPLSALFPQPQSKHSLNHLLKPSRHHRVHITAAAPATTSNAGEDTLSTGATAAAGEFSFDDCLFLLRSHEVVDEMTCLKEEITHMNAELEALQKDKTQLEDILASSSSSSSNQYHNQASAQSPQLPPTLSSPSQEQSSDHDPTGAGIAIVPTTGHNNIPTAWDVNALLGSRNITVAQRSQLQTQRGTNLTVYFHDRNASEALATRCGIKTHILAKFKEAHKQQQQHQQELLQQQRIYGSGNMLMNAASLFNNPLLLELTADTCREGGAATHIQQIALLCKEGGTELSFFLGRDQGKSVCWGHLPDRLFRRMQDQGMNPKQSASELAYVATGPMDYYYAEFRSGEAWWGSAVEDRAFHSICTEWDVYRVTFGPCLVVEDDQDGMGCSLGGGGVEAGSSLPTGPMSSSSPNGAPSQQQQQPHRHKTSSWVILSRDGRVAWKNIPSRLDRLLQSRVASDAGVAEVSLGCGDSYFCRFLDGTVDYCLPSTVAAICEQLESTGSTTITSIALHPELSHDFVIRSSSLN